MHTDLISQITWPITIMNVELPDRGGRHLMTPRLDIAALVSEGELLHATKRLLLRNTEAIHDCFKGIWPNRPIPSVEVEDWDGKAIVECRLCDCDILLSSLVWRISHAYTRWNGKAIIAFSSLIQTFLQTCPIRYFDVQRFGDDQPVRCEIQLGGKINTGCVWTQDIVRSVLGSLVENLISDSSRPWFTREIFSTPDIEVSNLLLLCFDHKVALRLGGKLQVLGNSILNQIWPQAMAMYSNWTARSASLKFKTSRLTTLDVASHCFHIQNHCQRDVDGHPRANTLQIAYERYCGARSEVRHKYNTLTVNAVATRDSVPHLLYRNVKNTFSILGFKPRFHFLISGARTVGAASLEIDFSTLFWEFGRECVPLLPCCYSNVQPYHVDSYLHNRRKAILLALQKISYREEKHIHAPWQQWFSVPPICLHHLKGPYIVAALKEPWTPGTTSSHLKMTCVKKKIGKSDQEAQGSLELLQGIYD